MTKLTNEHLESIINRKMAYSPDMQSVATELLELRKLRDSAGEFDEPTRFKEAIEQMKAGVATDSAYIRGARTQYKEDHLAYAALMVEAEKLVEALNDERNHWHRFGEDAFNCTACEALTAWREKYGEKK